MLYSFITVSAPTLLKFGMCVEIKCVEKCSLVSMINQGIYWREEEGINIVRSEKRKHLHVLWCFESIAISLGHFVKHKLLISEEWLE